MKRIVRLTESDLTRIVSRVIKEKKESYEVEDTEEYRDDFLMKLNFDESEAFPDFGPKYDKFMDNLDDYIIDSGILEELIDLDELPKSNRSRKSNQRSNRGIIDKLPVIISNYNDAIESEGVFYEASENLDRIAKSQIEMATSEVAMAEASQLGAVPASRRMNLPVDPEALSVRGTLVTPEIAARAVNLDMVMANEREKRRLWERTVLRSIFPPRRRGLAIWRAILVREAENFKPGVSTFPANANIVYHALDTAKREKRAAEDGLRRAKAAREVALWVESTKIAVIIAEERLNEATAVVEVGEEAIKELEPLNQAMKTARIEKNNKIDILRQSLKNLFSSNLRLPRDLLTGLYNSIGRGKLYRKKRNHKSRKCKSKRCHKKSRRK